MGCDIHIYSERFDAETFKWVVITNKDEWSYNFYNNQLQKILSDNKSHIKSIFNGEITQLESNIKESENTINWLPGDRNYSGFGYIADVRNYNNEIEPFKKGGEEDPSNYDLSPE